MNSTVPWLQRALQPSLVRRSVLAVLLAFVLVWVVLLAYLYAERKHVQATDHGLLRFAAAFQSALPYLNTDAEGSSFTAATAAWLNVQRRDIRSRTVGRAPGEWEFELLDPEGRRVYATPGLASDRLPHPSPAVQEIVVQGTQYLLVEARSARWVLRIAEPVRTDQAFLLYNANFLLPYLAIALPIVLLAIWLPIRRGLRPLQALTSHIEQRDANDLRPIAFEARHRELKPLVGALDDLLARLRQRVERERAFVQDAAHEIRTPLAVINAQAHVLAHASDAAERAQAEAQLDHAIERTSHMAQQLLELAALDEDSPRAARVLDVAHWLRGTLAPAAQQAIAQGMDLSLDAPDALRRAVDVAALSSIVHNLVDNALRYGARGNTVAVSLQEDGHELVLSVRDDGAGIAQADQARVFERFYRGSGHDARGSGLGLAIVRQAALRMHGRVEIGEGLNGRGVGFELRLPAAA